MYTYTPADHSYCNGTKLKIPAVSPCCPSLFFLFPLSMHRTNLPCILSSTMQSTGTVTTAKNIKCFFTFCPYFIKIMQLLPSWKPNQHGHEEKYQCQEASWKGTQFYWSKNNKDNVTLRSNRNNLAGGLTPAHSGESDSFQSSDRS